MDPTKVVTPQPAEVTNYDALAQQGPNGLLTDDLRINHEGLRNNSLLRKDEWEMLDESIITIARQRLIVVEDLRAAGLVRNLNSLGVMIDQWETSSDMTDADISLSGVTPGNEDLPEFGLQGVPIPIVHKDFRINRRHLEASRRLGSSIDVTGAEIATRKVRDALEDLVIAGTTKVRIGDSRIYGYTTHPQRNTGSLTGDWTAQTGETILGDVQDMIADAEAALYFGPYTLYVPTAYASPLRGDFKSNSDKTVRQRLLEMDQISSIKVVDRMPADNVVLVQLTRDVVDLSVGQDIAPVDWQTMGGFVQHFKVLAAMAPRVKSDHNDGSGVVHYTV